MTNKIFIGWDIGGANTKICLFDSEYNVIDVISENIKQAATSITGTVAKPSNPSVRFTALEDPTITKIEKGIKNQLKLIIKFLKNGK